MDYYFMPCCPNITSGNQTASRTGLNLLCGDHFIPSAFDINNTEHPSVIKGQSFWEGNHLCLLQQVCHSHSMLCISQRLNTHDRDACCMWHINDCSFAWNKCHKHKQAVSIFSVTKCVQHERIPKHCMSTLLPCTHSGEH